MRSKAFVLILLSIALLATVGCHRKKVTTAPDADSAESCWSQNRRAHPVVTGRSDG